MFWMWGPRRRWYRPYHRRPMGCCGCLLPLMVLSFVFLMMVLGSCSAWTMGY